MKLKLEQKWIVCDIVIYLNHYLRKECHVMYRNDHNKEVIISMTETIIVRSHRHNYFVQTYDQKGFWPISKVYFLVGRLPHGLHLDLARQKQGI